MYMSYCKFEGTLSELRNCLGDVENHINEEAEYEVSEREIGFFRRIITEMYEFMCDLNLLNEYGELDEEELDRICEAMKKGYDE